MWRLVGELPRSVDIDGALYPIKSDFRTSIAFSKLMAEGDDMVWADALELYYGGIPAKVDDAVAAVVSFYGCGAKDGQNQGEGSQDKILDFELDMPYIYAAFMDQYGIDLYDVENLHWWRFMAMFRGLKQDARIVEIMGYRSAKEERWMSDIQKKEIRRLHKIWDLDQRTVDEIEAEAMIIETLKAGGSLAELRKAVADD